MAQRRFAQRGKLLEHVARLLINPASTNGGSRRKTRLRVEVAVEQLPIARALEHTRKSLFVAG
jgi:hypothetical protein